MTVNPDNWDEHWSQYSSSADANPAQSYRFDSIFRLILSEVGVPAQIVDIGCGTGALLQEVSVRFPTVEILGVEPSTTGAEYSASRLGHDRVIRIDITRDKFNSTLVREGSVVVCTEVLEHLDNPLVLLKSIRDHVMRDDSRIVLSVPGGYRSAYDRHIGHREHFTRRRLENLLQEAGYSNIRVYRSGFPFFNVYKLSVILLGKKLIENPDKYASAASGPSRIGKVAHKLMKMSFVDSPFGWQIFAVASR